MRSSVFVHSPTSPRARPRDTSWFCPGNLAFLIAFPLGLLVDAVGGRVMTLSDDTVFVKLERQRAARRETGAGPRAFGATRASRGPRRPPPGGGRRGVRL